MALRFRRSIRIAKGIRLNVGKGGVSVSAGVRGASVTVGKRGTYANVGLPGTGLSFRSKIGGGATRTSQRRQAYQERERALEQRREALSNVSLNLMDDGTIQVLDKYGAELASKDVKWLWTHKEETIKQWLSEQRDKLNADNELIIGIHEDTPAPNQHPEYEPPSFELPEPLFPTKAHTHFFLRSIPWLGRWLQTRRQAKLDQAYLNDLRTTYPDHPLQSTTADNAYQEIAVYWQTALENHNAHVKRGEEEFHHRLHHDEAFMEEVLASAIDELDWPRDTQVSYEIREPKSTVFVDVDLPEIEDIPNKRYDLTATTKRLSIKTKSQKEQREHYAIHVHGIALRLAGTVFATLPSTQQVVISGYSQRRNPANGHIQDDYLYSAKLSRDAFTKLNFSDLGTVDPIEALASFEIRRNMTKTGIFKSIEPFSSEVYAEA